MKIEKKALKVLRKMPKTTALKFYKAFEKIEENELEGLDVKQMKNSEYSRLRIGKYRAIYNVDFEIIVISVGARGGVYKK